MLHLLPIITFFILFLALLGAQNRSPETNPGIRAALLKTAALMGGYVVLSTEILSLFKALTQFWGATAWLLAFIGIGIYAWKSDWIRDGINVIKGNLGRVGKFNLVIGGILTVLLLMLFLVAIISPPNNNDSLFYHMSRVVHWAQNRTLAHYSSNYIHQAMQPIGAELFVLNLRLLWGSDKLANLVQFASLIGSIIAITAIASLFGVKNRGQWLSVAFAFGLPSGLLQATSTQNDLVAAFWLTSLLYFIFYAVRHKINYFDLICIGLILGLGVLTKATFYFYAVLPMVYFCVSRLYKSLTLKTIKPLLLLCGLAFVLNLGYWVRNQITFNSPFGQKEFISNNITVLDNPGLLFTGPIKMLAQNFMTPDESINTSMISWLRTTFKSIDPTMENITLEWGWNHEDMAGNPLHVILIILSLILLFTHIKHIPDKLLWLYLALILGSIFLVSVFTKDNWYGIRFQLPFFITWAPIFGFSIELIGKKVFSTIIIILLLIGSLPWVLFNRTRPLIAMRDSSDPFTIPCLAGCTTGSILNESPAYIVFGTLFEYRESYTQATDAIKSSGCRELSLQVDSHDPEYLIWWLLGAPQSGIRIETTSSIPELQRYTDPTFKPCAYMCTICSQSTIPGGFTLANDYGGILLYFNNNFVPDLGK
jgi:hypothetical protein